MTVPRLVGARPRDALPAFTAPPPKLRTIASNGASLSVRSVGNLHSGTPLLVLHGGPGMDSDYLFDSSVKAFYRDDRPLIFFDQRGAGRSSASTNGYGVNRFGEDVKAVLDTLGVTDAHLFAHSWGSVPAYAFMTMHDGANMPRVKSLAIYGGVPPTFAAWGNAENQIGKVMAAYAQAHPPEGTNAPQTFGETLGPYLFDPAWSAPAELKDARMNTTTFNKTLADVEGFDFTRGLQGYRGPVLIADGAADPFGHQMFVDDVSAFPNAQLTPLTVMRAGHFFQENIGPLARAVDRLTQRTQGGR